VGHGDNRVKGLGRDGRLGKKKTGTEMGATSSGRRAQQGGGVRECGLGNRGRGLGSDVGSTI
jgi:hypothetical protein